MNRDQAVMIIIFSVVVFAIAGLMVVRQIVNYCKTEGDTTDAESVCFKPSDFCKMKCESFGDIFTGDITMTMCVCENGAVTHDPTMKQIREYWNETTLLNI